MGFLRKVKEKVAGSVQRWPDIPWRKDLPIRRRLDGKKYDKVVRSKDLLETIGRCPRCGGKTKVTERWVERVYGDEEAPFYDRFPGARIYECTQCGVVLEDFTDLEKDVMYQRAEAVK